MSMWALGVCQSRNWEAFSVDLWGQGLPKAPLQNNSRPGSWQWDTGGCCSARPALKTLTPPPPPATLFLSPICHPQGRGGRALGNWQQECTEAAAITLPIWSVWNVAMPYCMWTDTFVMSGTTRGRWEGLANTNLIPTGEQDWNIVYTMTRPMHDSCRACK